MSEKKGQVHIYCGDGKGKTTAAIGLCVRAAGAGWRIIVAQFLKSWNTGEVDVLKKIGVTVLRLEGKYDFTWQLSEEEKAAQTAEHTALFRKAFELCGEGEKTLLVLDEMAATYGLGLIDRELVLSSLKNKPEALELVITGRNPSPDLVELADYITEMTKRRHPMDKGLPARKGVEF